MNLIRAFMAGAFALVSFSALAADYPAPKEGDFIAKDFKLHTGETIAELRLHYTTIGDPSHPTIVVLHGSGGECREVVLDLKVKRMTVLPPIGKFKRYPTLELTVLHATERPKLDARKTNHERELGSANH